MTGVSDIAAHFETLAPCEMKMDFDNVGLLVGISQRGVTRALLALDITDEVISEAIALKAELIISHHPLFFELKRVCDDEPNGKKVMRLLQNGISALCLHTNLDAADGGVNDALAETLGVRVEGRLEELALPSGTRYGVGRFGCLAAPLSMPEFLARVKTALNTGGIRYHDAGVPVRKVALCGGSGGEYLERAAALGCDTLVTADVKYHQLLLAKELGLNLLDADHFCTENVVIPVLKEQLCAAFPDVEALISSSHAQTARFF